MAGLVLLNVSDLQEVMNKLLQVTSGTSLNFPIDFDNCTKPFHRRTNGGQPSKIIVTNSCLTRKPSWKSLINVSKLFQNTLPSHRWEKVTKVKVYFFHIFTARFTLRRPTLGHPPLGSSRHTPCCELQASEQWRRSGHRLCSWTCEAPQCWCTFQGVRNIQLKISFCPKYCFRKVWRRLDPWAWWMNLKTWRTALKHGGSP